MHLKNWMSQNLLQIKQKKNKEMLFGSKYEKLEAAVHLKDKALKVKSIKTLEFDWVQVLK